MTLFNYITNNQDQIKFCVKIGLMPCSIISHLAIYSRYDYYKRLNYTCRDSIFYVADDAHVSEKTVRRIIKKMKTEL